MTTSFKPLLVSFLLLMLVSAGRAQESGSAEKALKLHSQLLQTTSMVREIAAEAPLWDNKVAAVQVLADAADLLWDENPSQATRWLRKAWELIEQVSAAPRDEKLKAFFTRSQQTELRTLVLSVARKHDAEWADQLLKQLATQEPADKHDRGAFDDRTARSEQLLQMAQQVIAANPELSFSLAESSLVDGVSYSLQNILTTLRRNNIRLANQLFDAALARFRSGNPEASEAEALAGYLFQSGFTFSTNSGGQTMLVLNPAQQNLPTVAASEPQRAREFLTAVYQLLLVRPVVLNSPEGKLRAQQILALGTRLSGPYRNFAPELAPAAQGFLAQLQRLLIPPGETVTAIGTTRTMSEGDSLKRTNKEERYEALITELEDTADKESNLAFRRVAYIQAAVATRPEDYLRAKRIAEKIDDADLRADGISFVLYRAALFFVGKEDPEKAIELIPQITDGTRRAVARIATVQRLLTVNSQHAADQQALRFNQQRAFDLLANVDLDLRKTQPSATVAKIRLAQSALWAQFDSAQALVALEHAALILNKLENFNVRDARAPDLGLAVFAASGATVPTPRLGYDLRGAIEPLITTDFDQALAILSRLTAKDVSGMARMELAKLFLQKTALSPGRSAAEVRKPHGA